MMRGADGIRTDVDGDADGDAYGRMDGTGRTDGSHAIRCNITSKLYFTV